MGRTVTGEVCEVLYVDPRHILVTFRTSGGSESHVLSLRDGAMLMDALRDLLSSESEVRAVSQEEGRV